MPTYSCTHQTGSLTAQQKTAVAGEITRIHAAVTGAPTSFVHVVFHEHPVGDLYSDAKPSNPLLIVGLIRDGHSDTDKQRLVLDLSAACARVTGRSEKDIVVGVTDSPAKFAVEGGRVLPEPGAERDWLSNGPALPANAQATPGRVPS
jgi:phenylpyruvate tautomerase PptA (4-oxalocrotonate tautomerase family)